MNNNNPLHFVVKEIAAIGKEASSLLKSNNMAGLRSLHNEVTCTAKLDELVELFYCCSVDKYAGLLDGLRTLWSRFETARVKLEKDNELMKKFKIAKWKEQGMQEKLKHANTCADYLSHASDVRFEASRKACLELLDADDTQWRNRLPRAGWDHRHTTTRNAITSAKSLSAARDNVVATQEWLKGRIMAARTERKAIVSSVVGYDIYDRQMNKPCAPSEPKEVEIQGYTDETCQAMQHIHVAWYLNYSNLSPLKAVACLESTALKCKDCTARELILGLVQDVNKGRIRVTEIELILHRWFTTYTDVLEDNETTLV